MLLVNDEGRDWMSFADWWEGAGSGCTAAFYIDAVKGMENLTWIPDLLITDVAWPEIMGSSYIGIGADGRMDEGAVHFSVLRRRSVEVLGLPTSDVDACRSLTPLRRYQEESERSSNHLCRFL